MFDAGSFKRHEAQSHPAVNQEFEPFGKRCSAIATAKIKGKPIAFGSIQSDYVSNHTKPGNLQNRVQPGVRNARNYLKKLAPKYALIGDFNWIPENIQVPADHDLLFNINNTVHFGAGPRKAEWKGKKTGMKSGNVIDNMMFSNDWKIDFAKTKIQDNTVTNLSDHWYIVTEALPFTPAPVTAAPIGFGKAKSKPPKKDKGAKAEPPKKEEGAKAETTPKPTPQPQSSATMNTDPFTTMLISTLIFFLGLFLNQ